MRRFVEGTDRGQSTLFPECLGDWISENNPVRVIDVFVDELDLAELGFNGVEPEVTGRPSYHPSVLLKLYIYGYLNRIQSSRRHTHFLRPAVNDDFYVRAEVLRFGKASAFTETRVVSASTGKLVAHASLEFAF
jgi:transposase